VRDHQLRVVAGRGGTRLASPWPFVPSARLFAPKLLPHSELSWKGSSWLVFSTSLRKSSNVPISPSSTHDREGKSLRRRATVRQPRRHRGGRAGRLAVCTIAMAEFDSVLTDKRILLADNKDGKPLTAPEGPFPIIVPDEKAPNRWVNQVSAIYIAQVFGPSKGGDSSYNACFLRIRFYSSSGSNGENLCSGDSMFSAAGRTASGLSSRSRLLTNGYR